MVESCSLNGPLPGSVKNPLCDDEPHTEHCIGRRQKGHDQEEHGQLQPEVVATLVCQHGEAGVEGERGRVSGVGDALDDGERAHLPVVRQVARAQQQPEVVGGQVQKGQQSGSRVGIFKIFIIIFI